MKPDEGVQWASTELFDCVSREGGAGESPDGDFHLTVPCSPFQGEFGEDRRV